MTGDTGLLTDHYELTMLQAALRDGTAERRCVFEVFTRRLPEGRRYGVVAGTGRLLDAIPHFRYDDEQLAGLRRTGVVDEATCRWLDGYRFAGDVSGYVEGEVFLPGSPVLTVEGTFAEAVLLETLALIDPQPRQRRGLRGGPDGLRRRRPAMHRDGLPAHPRGGGGRRGPGRLRRRVRGDLQPGRRSPVRRPDHRNRCPLLDAAARAGGRRVPRPGRRRSASAPRCSSTPTTSPQGIRTAVEVAGPHLGAVRIDSGDLAVLAHQTREQLDSLGARDTRIVLSGDLDEFALAALATAPVDAYGVGTSVVTGSGAPTAGFVYKLVEVEGRAVAKRSEDKSTRGGRKTAVRRHRSTGTATEEVVRPQGPPSARDGDRALQHPMVRGGELLDVPTLDESRAHLKRVLTTLPWQGLALSKGEPAIPTTYEEPPAHD